VIVRRYRPDDFDPVNDLWRRSRLAAFPDVQARTGHTAEDDRDYFREVVQVKNDVWVAEVHGRPAAFMAIAGDFIDQLHVAPEHQRRGLGAALLAHARAVSPSGLRAVHLSGQRERPARAHVSGSDRRRARLSAPGGRSA
jgi:GNAT superfamily N-acetyltransferase